MKRSPNFKHTPRLSEGIDALLDRALELESEHGDGSILLLPARWMERLGQVGIERSSFIDAAGEKYPRVAVAYSKEAAAAAVKFAFVLATPNYFVPNASAGVRVERQPDGTLLEAIETTGISESMLAERGVIALVMREEFMPFNSLGEQNWPDLQPLCYGRPASDDIQLLAIGSVGATRYLN